MNLEQLRDRCLSRNGAGEEYPFGPEYPTFKVEGKIFALVFLDKEPPWVNLKCDPLHAEALRAYYPAVRPGYYLHKRHWNCIVLDGSVPTTSSSPWSMIPMLWWSRGCRGGCGRS